MKYGRAVVGVEYEVVDVALVFDEATWGSRVSMEEDVLIDNRVSLDGTALVVFDPTLFEAAKGLGLG